MFPHLFTLIFVVLTLGTILFQIGLVLGKPWGHLTQGGRFDGVLPRSGRIVAAVSALVLAAFILIILVRSGRIMNHRGDARLRVDSRFLSLHTLSLSLANAPDPHRGSGTVPCWFDDRC